MQNVYMFFPSFARKPWATHAAPNLAFARPSKKRLTPPIRLNTTMLRITALLYCATAVAQYSPALAADGAYPARPVRVVVPAPPGGTADLVARVLAPKLAEQMTQSFVVDNRGGAGGVVAAELVAAASPDGYTLASIYTSFTTNVALRKNPSYDPITGYSYVSMVMWSPLVLVTNPGVPANSVKELIALSKSRDLHYASAGNGTGGHMCGELFKSLTGARAVHVPYKGAALGTNDVVAGAVQYAFVGPITAVGLVKAGKLRMLAVTSLKRNPAFPDIPSVDEQTGTGYEVVNWFGVAGPANLPRSIVTRLNGEIGTALQSPEVRKRLGGDGAQIIGNTPEYFAQFIKRDLEKWRGVVTKAGITLD